MRAQFGWGQAVLAGQIVDPHQATLQLVQPLRVRFQVVADPGDHGQGFLDLGRCAFEQDAGLGQARFVGRRPRHPGTGLLQLPGQGRGLVVAQPGQGLVAGGDQAGGIGLAAVGRIQGLQCGRVQVFPFQFGQLVLQPADPVGDIALGQQGLAFVQQGLPACRGRTHGIALGLVAGVAVQQGQLAGAREQGLVFVLAVDLHQLPGQLGQLGQGGRATIDPGARTAIGADHPPQLALAILVQVVVTQPRHRGRGGGQVEVGRQFGPFAAMADHAAVGAQPGQEAQCVHQQRLAGAGLAGNDGHARAELQFGGADDGEILQGQVGEHGRIVGGQGAAGVCRPVVAYPATV